MKDLPEKIYLFLIVIKDSCISICLLSRTMNAMIHMIDDTIVQLGLFCQCGHLVGAKKEKQDQLDIHNFIAVLIQATVNYYVPKPVYSS